MQGYQMLGLCFLELIALANIKGLHIALEYDGHTQKIKLSVKRKQQCFSYQGKSFIAAFKEASEFHFT